MALPTPNTFTAAVLSVDGNAIKDGVAEATITLERETTQVDTWGGSVAGVGSIRANGNIRAIYEEGANTAARVLMDELMTPTAGGIAVIFQPLGAGSGTLYELTFNIIIESGELGGEAQDIQEVNCAFQSTGAISYALQSA